MKRSYMLLIAGLMASLGSAALGQTLIRAIIKTDDIAGGRPTEIFVAGGNRSTLLYKQQQQEVDNRQMPYTRVRELYFRTPQEYISANTSYQNAKYQEARAKYAEAKNKYKFTETLPGNYSVLAAFREVDCAARMLDWPGVKNLSAQLPRQAYLLTNKLAADTEVYNLLGRLADNNPDQVITAAKAMLVNKNKYDLQQAARIYYALGIAQATKGETENALNSLAMTIAGQHGGGLDLAASAILKSMDILAADKAVTEYVRAAGSDELSPQMRASAPQKIQELAGLAYLYKNILFRNRTLDAKYETYLRFYVTPVERRAIEAAKNQAEEGDTPQTPETQQQGQATAQPADGQASAQAVEGGQD